MHVAASLAAALLVVGSSQTAAESSQHTWRQGIDLNVTRVEDVVIPTKPQLFRENRVEHNDLSPIAADEDRVGEDFLTGIEQIVMKAARNVALTDDEKEIMALRTAMKKASRNIQDGQQVTPPGDPAIAVDDFANRISNEWIELTPDRWAEKINMPPQESHVTRDETHAAGQTDTSRKQKHFAPLSKTMKQRSISLTKLNRALPPGITVAPKRPYIKGAYNEIQQKAIHDEFLEVCNPSYSPTKDETLLLWKLASYAQDYDGRIRLQGSATRNVIGNMMILMVEDSMWKRWLRFTDLQRAKLLNDSLNAHYQRWRKMLDIFCQELPKRSSWTKILPSVRKQPRLDDNVSKRKNFVPPMIANSHPRLIGTTSSELINTALSTFGNKKSERPRLDDRIDKSSDLAPPVHLESPDHSLVEPTTSKLTTIDFLSNWVKNTHSRHDDNIG